MLATVVTDAAYDTLTFRHVYGLVEEALSQRGFTVDRRDLREESLASCIGCFGCWVKDPGRCLIRDTMDDLNNRCMRSDVVVYLSPVVFGQFSGNMKCAIDRWLPNMLPYFIRRPDGSTIHSPRYKTYPCQFMIGYGDGLSAEDAQLFVDITMKHRRGVAALVYRGDDGEIGRLFEANKLGRVAGAL